MALDLGELSVVFSADDTDLTRKLDKAGDGVKGLFDEVKKFENTKLDVAPTGAGEVDKAKRSAEQLGRELGRTGDKAGKVKMATQPREETAKWREEIRKTGDDLGGQLGKWASGGIKWAGITAGAAAIGGMGTALTKGFGRLNNIDQATAKLEALGNSGSDVKNIMDNALASVKGTAFGIGEAAGTAATMVASGVEPGKELESVLVGVADSAAIAGVGMDDMGLIWGKVAAKGKLDGETMAQMLERQIPIYDILAEKTGDTSEEIADMVSGGKISFETFSDAMNDYVGGGALRMGETFSGAVDNMWAAAGRLGEAFLAPAFESAPGVVGGITDSIDGLTEKVKPAAKEWANNLAPHLSEFGKSVGPQVNAAMSTLGDTLGVVGPLIGELASAMGKVPFPVYAGGIMALIANHKGWNDSLEAGGGVLKTFAGKIGDMATGELSLATGAMNGLKGAGEGLLGFFGGPWGLAIGVAAGAVTLLMQEHQKAKVAEEEHKAAQEALKDTLDITTGAITEQTNELVRKQLTEANVMDTVNELGISQDLVTSAAQGNAKAQEEVQSRITLAGEAAVEASDKWAKYKDDFEAAGITSHDVAKALTGDGDELKRIVNTVGEDGSNLIGELNQIVKSTSDTTDGFKGLSDAVGSTSDNLEQAQFDDATERLNNFERQVARTKDVIEELGDAQISLDSATSISVEATPETLATREMLDEIEGVTTNVMEGRLHIDFEDGYVVSELLETLGMKLTQLPGGYIGLDTTDMDEAQAMADALGAEVQTIDGNLALSYQDIPEAMTLMEELGILVRDPENLNGEVEIDWDAIQTSSEQMDSLRSNVSKGSEGKVQINSNLDSTLTKAGQLDARNGKRTTETHTVIREERRITYWESQGYSSAQASAVQGPVPVNANGNVYDSVAAFADGGVNRAVARRARSAHEPSHDAHIAPAGSYRVFAESETGGEAYIPLSPAKRGRSSKILSDVANRFGYQISDVRTGEVQAFADGGISGDIKGKLRFMDGTPYAFGGWSPSGVDCSGAVALVDNARRGVDLFGGGRFSTMNQAFELAKRGWLEGRGSAGDFRTGFYNGGPAGGHTHVQLPDGTHVESGGNTGGGFTIGKSAGPLSGRGYTNWWYYPSSPAVGNAGLDYLDSLGGVVSRGDSGITTTTNVGGMSVERELNGGHGTLLEDGSLLELVAAVHSARTGQPMDDDIVSWGQAIGLYSKVKEDDAAKLAEEAANSLENLDKSKDSLEDKKLDLQEAREELRIKRIQRDETYNKRDKDGKLTASEVQKAQSDQTVAKQERKVNGLEAEITALEAEIKELSVYENMSAVSGTSGNKYADEIIAEGKRRGISNRGIKIALAAALAESDLKMYANPVVPESMGMTHDAVGSDHDSVGLFQQRNNGAWGTTSDRMNPAKSAGMFYDKLDDADYNKGDAGSHAQRVQGSAFPGRYAQSMDEAQSLLERYTKSGMSIAPMANGGILGNARNAHINDGSSAVLWAEAGPEAYIPLSSNKKARSTDIWLETGKRLGYDVMSMMNFIAAGLPGLLEGNFDFNSGSTVSAAEYGLNMDAAGYRGAQPHMGNARRSGHAAGVDAANSIGAVFNGPVNIQDPEKYLNGQLNNARNELQQAIRSVMP